MFFPLRTDARLHSVPWMNLLIIFANLVLWFYQWTHPHLLDGYMLSPRTPQLLHFLTYAFLHSGWGHVMGNMLFLYIFGNNVNDRLGAAGYLAFYLAGAVFAGIGFVVTQQGTNSVVGASGAVAAVTAAYLVLFPQSNVTIVYFLIFFIGQFEVTSMVMIVFFFLKDLFFGVFGVAEGGQTVAHTAHIGGSVFGFAITLLLVSAGLLPRSQYDLVALLGRWNRRRQYRALVRQGYNPFEGPAPEPTGRVADLTPDPVQDRVIELRGQIANALNNQNLPGAAALYLRLKSVDPTQVLARQAQLDVANELAHEQQYAATADAYRAFLKSYGAHDSAGHVELMLGLILSRYLDRPDEAKAHLKEALDRVRTDRDRELARSELDHIAGAG